MKVFWWTVLAMNMLAVIVTGLVTFGWLHGILIGVRLMG